MIIIFSFNEKGRLLKGSTIYMTALKVEDVAVAYSNTLIIDGLNVSIPNKKITTIIGPNGCGKSTLLKTISRL